GRSATARRACLPPARLHHVFTAGERAAGALTLHEEEVLTPWQRAIGERLLTAGGRFHHVVRPPPGEFVELNRQRRDALHERDRERAVAAVAVKRRLPVLGCKYNQRPALHRDFAQAASDRARN